MSPIRSTALSERVRHARGIAFMLLAVSAVALLDSAAKLLTQTYPVMQVAWARYAFHVMLMVVFLGPRHGLDLVRMKRPDLQLARGAVLTIATIVFFSALSLMPIAEASAIAFISPLLVTALAVPLLGERSNASVWGAVVLGFAGTLLIIRPGSAMFTWHAVWPLVTALCFAGYQIITRMLSGRDKPVTTLFMSALIGTVVLSAITPFHWKPVANAVDWMLLLSLGVSGSVSHWLFIKAFDHAPAPLLAPMVYVQLVIVTLIGWAGFGEFPDGWSLTGMIVIIFAGLWTITRGRMLPATPPAAD